jgi:hypothetical protein
MVRPRDYGYINKKRFVMARTLVGIPLADFAKEMGLSKTRLDQFVKAEKWPVEHFATLEDLTDMPATWFSDPRPPKLEVEK